MKKLHFAGIGGIGMSGLAAMACCQGIEVTGSDRGADRPENQRIIGALKNQGIRIYPQDGSFIRDGKPDFIVYSTAIEEDNPDFLAAGDVPRLHRSALLGMLTSASGQETIAVTGSCGKSTVTAYMAETLFNLGSDPSCLNGALSKRFKSDCFAGNYRQGQGRYLVFEADESDKSLLNYQVDYAVILNIGTDHYSKEELAEVFGKFLGNVRKGAILSDDVFAAVKDFIPPGLAVKIFYPEAGADRAFALQDYSVSGGRAHAVFSGCGKLALPLTGRHNALNALAIFALLDLLGFEHGAVLRSLERFDGIFRRTDFAGKTFGGALVYDDYAHNPEKIISCLNTMREMGGKRIYHAGDTALISDMALLAEEDVDVALLPIGDVYTMGPADALRAAKLIRPKLVVPMHYNTFPAIAQDPEAFATTVEAAGIACRVLKPGETLEI